MFSITDGDYLKKMLLAEIMLAFFNFLVGGFLQRNVETRITTKTTFLQISLIFLSRQTNLTMGKKNCFARILKIRYIFSFFRKRKYFSI